MSNQLQQMLKNFDTLLEALKIYKKRNNTNVCDIDYSFTDNATYTIHED